MTTKEFDIAVMTFVEQFRTRALLDALGIRSDGGPGSGNFGHKGVEGQVGGSAPSGGSKNSYKAPETQMEKYALQDNDSATGFLMREGMGWKEAVALHDSGKALDKAKEVIDKRHKEQEARYEHASEGQKKLMRMSADTADKFVQECYKKPVDESLNRGSKTQHVVSELGIDAKPTVLGREAFEKAVAESPSGVMYRGVTGTGNLTAEEICKLTIESDKQYVGNGFHGDGTYFSTRLGTAAGYTHNPDGVSTGLMTACLSPDARIIDSRTLGAAYNDFQISDASTRALYMGYNVIAHEANRFADGTVEMYYITLDRSALCFLDEHQDAADDGKKVIDGQALADVWNAFIIRDEPYYETEVTVSPSKGNRDQADRNDDEGWITVNGTHVKLNDEGIAESGGKLKGMSFSNAKSQKRFAKPKRSEAQDKALKKIAKRTANLKKEQMRIVDKDGKVLLEKKGDKGSVSATVGEKRELLGGNVSIHNHPDGGTFSAADLSDFGFGATEMVVSTPEGTYTLTNEKYGTPDQSKGWLDMRDALEREVPSDVSAIALLKQARENLKDSHEMKEMNRISDTWVKMKNSGKSQEELNDYYRNSGYDALNNAYKANVEKEKRRLEVQPHHDFFVKNASRYGFKYTFEPTGRKDGFTGSIGRKPMFSYARLSKLLGFGHKSNFDWTSEQARGNDNAAKGHVSEEDAKKAKGKVDSTPNIPKEYAELGLDANLMKTPLTFVPELDDPPDTGLGKYAKMRKQGIKPNKEKIDIRKALTDQCGVNREKVKQYIDAYHAGTVDKESHGDPIIAVKNGENVFIFNGNHRVAAAKMLGMDKVEADVYDVT